VFLFGVRHGLRGQSGRKGNVKDSGTAEWPAGIGGASLPAVPPVLSCIPFSLIKRPRIAIRN
ncbi:MULTISPECIES: hypothetical protein, partial [Cupriavidus]